MNKTLLILFGVLLLAGGIFTIVMTVMAAIFMEYGRFIFYMSLAFVCFGCALVLFLKLKDFQS